VLWYVVTSVEPGCLHLQGRKSNRFYRLPCTAQSHYFLQVALTLGTANYSVLTIAVSLKAPLGVLSLPGSVPLSIVAACSSSVPDPQLTCQFNAHTSTFAAPHIFRPLPCLELLTTDKQYDTKYATRVRPIDISIHRRSTLQSLDTAYDSCRPRTQS
jgi:hypothetical protein